MQYIEELIDREEILKEITEQNNTFDISEFYLGDRDGNGAVGILTPNQTIYNYSVLEHGNVVEKILAEIYSDFKEFNVKLHESWQQKTVDMGDICIQLCTGCSTVIWIPEEINKEQFSEFKSYVEEVKKVDKLLESNGEETLEFICNLEESKDIDEILELAKQRVVDVLKKQKDENIIVENTNRIGNNIFDISNLDLENIAADGKNVRIESDEFLKEKTLLEKSEKVEKNCEGVR